MKREARRSTNPELESSAFEGAVWGPDSSDAPSAGENAETVNKPEIAVSDASDTPSAAGNAAAAEDIAAMLSEIPQKTEKSAPAPRKSRRKNSRKAVDNRISRIMVLIFVVFALLIALFLLVIPRSTFSEIERRSLSTWPEFTIDNYFSGRYTSGIAQVYDDTVPARDSFKNAGNNIKAMFGIRSSGAGEIIGNAGRIQDKQKETEPAAPPVETEVKPDTADTVETADTGAEDPAKEPETPAAEEPSNSKDYHVENYNAFIEDGIVVVLQDGHWRAITLFGGIYDTVYSETVNYMHSVLGDSVNLYFMPIPTACQFYLPSNYQDYSVDQSVTFAELSAQMAPGVHCVNIIDAENNHNEEDIYLRTDHHWAPLGAYYGAREFAKAAGVPFADLSTYTKKVNPGYVGTMYAYTESANILNDPEDFVYYEPSNSYVVDYYDTAFNYAYTGSLFVDQSAYVGNSYSTFMGGDALICKITTDVKNGRKLVVVKDSFGNALIPFLTGSFEEVFVTDQRYFDINFINFITYNGITDVLFGHSFYSCGSNSAELLRNITLYNSEIAFYDGAPEAVLPGSEAEKEAQDDAAQDAEEADAAVQADTAEDTAYDWTADAAAYDWTAEEAYDTGYDWGTYDGYTDTDYNWIDYDGDGYADAIYDWTDYDGDGYADAAYDWTDYGY